MDARFSRPMEAWSRCSPAEQVTTDSCDISSQRVDKILFYSILDRRFELWAYNSTGWSANTSSDLLSILIGPMDSGCISRFEIAIRKKTG